MSRHCENRSERPSRPLSVWLLVCWLLSCLCAGAARAQQTPEALEPGKSRAGELAGGQTQAYLLTLKSGQFARALVEQRTVNFTLAVIAPDGKQIAAFNSVGGHDLSAISLIADTDGAYRLEIRAPGQTAAAGRYGVRLDTVRAATDTDRGAVRAQQLWNEALPLSRQNAPEARRQALARFEEAAALWTRANARLELILAQDRIAGLAFQGGDFTRALALQQAGREYWRELKAQRSEAETLLFLGMSYERMKEYQKSLAAFQEALVIFQRMGERQAQARAHNGLGMTWTTMGEYQRALESRLSALEIWRATGNRYMEAAMLNATAMSYLALGNRKQAREQLRLQEVLLDVQPDVRTRANSLIGLGISYRRMAEFDRSVEVQEKALRLFESLGDRDGMMRVNNALARLATDRGDARKTLDLRHKSLPYYEETGNQGFANYLRVEIARAHADLGEFAKTEEVAREVIRIASVNGDTGNLLDAWTTLGYMYLLSTGEYRKSIEAFENALKVNEKLGRKNGVITEMGALARCYLMLGDLDTARAILAKAESLPRQAIVPDGQTPEATALAVLGRLAAALGDERKAIRYYQQSLTLKQRDVEDIMGSSTFLELGNLYGSLGDYERQAEYISRAMSLVEETGDSVTDNAGYFLLSLIHIGDAQWNLPAFWRRGGPLARMVHDLNEKALTRYQRSERPHVAMPMAVLSTWHAAMGDQARARELATQALTRAAELPVTARLIVEYVCSQTWGALGEWRKAWELASANARNFTGDPGASATLEHQMASALRGLGRLEEARKHLEEAISLRETLLSRHKDEQTRRAVFATFSVLYEEYTSLLMQMHARDGGKGYDRQAFQSDERARARSLLETLIEARADIRRDGDPQLLAREQVLQRRVNTLSLLEERQRNGALPEAAWAETRQAIVHAYDELRQIRTQIRTSSPRYAALTQPQPPDVATIQQQMLDAETMLLVYSLGDERSFLWTLTHDSFTTYNLPPRAEIDKAARGVYELLTTRQRIGGLPPAQQQKQLTAAETAYQSEAAMLSRMLLGPAQAQLGHKRLLIVAPEALQYIPFGALPVPELVASGQWSVASKKGASGQWSVASQGAKGKQGNP
ncbi:MAG: tetratricopeptide repeat protein, partial [Blastocatellia bacterium]